MDESLVFLTNEWLNPNLQRQFNLPLTFITFALTEANMYRHFRNESTFILPPIKRRWGNSVVYGAVFHVPDASFHFRVLDAYHLCSLSTLYRNHSKDVCHRVRSWVAPIRFSSLEELSRLQYIESARLEVQMYFGNPKHPRIVERLNKTNSYRIQDGIDAKHFKELYEEVKYADSESSLHGRVDRPGT